MKKGIIWIAIVLMFFVMGTIAANLLFQDMKDSCYLFCESVRTRFLTGTLSEQKRMIYLLKTRGMIISVLLVSCIMRRQRILQVGIMVVFSFLYGICFVVCIISWGIKGIFISLTGMFPQMIFYLIAFIMIIGVKRTCGRQKIVKFGMAIILFTMGILSELYLNNTFVGKIFHFV